MACPLVTVLGYVVCEIGWPAVARPLVEALALQYDRAQGRRRLTGIVICLNEA
jgi:hypothetical protein